ncbi:GNAT family N-acetyltransferase [Actinomycetota bacterium]
MSELRFRDAIPGDASAINAIYNTYIVDSHVSFDTEPWSDERRSAWLADRIELGYPVIVAVDDGDVAGAAWSGPWREKAAYRTTVESTIVLADSVTGRGIGTHLYGVLLDRLRAAGFLVAVAIIALPNDASIALHTRLGYREVGVLEGVGVKGQRRHSTLIMECQLEA